MTVIDSSALIAILTAEPGGRRLAGVIADSPRRLLSAASLVETSIVLDARYGELAGRELDLLVHRAAVQVVAVDTEQAALARAAFRRFGKGQHPAGLNYGDLFSYALAKATGERLLYVGDDFSGTDIDAAV